MPETEAVQHTTDAVKDAVVHTAGSVDVGDIKDQADKADQIKGDDALTKSDLNVPAGAPFAKPPGQADATTDQEISDLAAIWSRVQASQNPFGAGGSSSDNLFHRRSSTNPYKAPWEPKGPIPQNQQPLGPTPASFLGAQKDRFQPVRRFSLTPNLPSAGDSFDMGMMRRGAQFPGRPLDPGAPPQMPIRRHSVAGPSYHAPGRFLSEAFNTLSLDDTSGQPVSSVGGGMPMGYGSLLEDFEELLDEGSRRPSISSSSEVGKGIALHSLPHDTNLYIVEFKAGRSDIFYVSDEQEGEKPQVKKGDLVIVEADRGRDLGKVINESITPYQIHMLQAQHSEALNDLHRVNREIHPKRIYRLAEPSEVAMLVTKSQDEAKALSVCQTKVRQKKLAMEVVDAEYQWDRRKLTFYFVADRRIDFRELVRDLFKIYKTRIWMCAVNPVMDQAGAPGNMGMIQKEKQF